MTVLDYNNEVKRLGYEHQKALGIINPSDMIKVGISQLKTKLINILGNFKRDFPSEYSDSIHVENYK